MKYRTIKDAAAYLNDIAEELWSLAEMDRMEMYRRLTQLGDDIPALLDGEQVPDNFVQGCISNVYIAHTLEEGHIAFRGKSDALLVRGYLSVLIQALSGLSTEDLLQDSQQLVEDFCEHTELQVHLTPSRANAFGNIYRLIRRKAEE